MIDENLDDIISNNEPSKEAEKIIKDYYKRPSIYFELLCGKYLLDFETYFDIYLDYMTKEFRKLYKTNGEDVTLPGVKDAIMKKAFYYTASKLALDVKKIKRRPKYRKKPFGSDWWEWGI